MQLKLVKNLIAFLHTKIPDCLITGAPSESEESSSFDLSIRPISHFGFEYYLKIANVDWSSGVPLITFYPGVGIYPDYLTNLLASFNPNE